MFVCEVKNIDFVIFWVFVSLCCVGVLVKCSVCFGSYIDLVVEYYGGFGIDFVIYFYLIWEINLMVWLFVEEKI